MQISFTRQIIVFSLLCLVIGCKSEIRNTNNDYQRFLGAVDSSAQYNSDVRSVFIGERYRALFPSSTGMRLRKLSVAEVEDLFNAAKIAEFYTKDNDALNDMLMYHSELAKRNGVTPNIQYDLYGAFIDERRFDEAIDFAKNSNLKIEESIPSSHLSVKDDDSYSFLKLHNNNLILQKLSLIGPKIIVVASPLCHFTQRAVGEIDKNEYMKEVLAEHSIWIIPEERELHIDALRSWNENNPSMQMSFVYHRKGWPIIGLWETPVFYFTLNGKVLRTVIGWPKDGNMKQMEDGLKEIGLM